MYGFQTRVLLSYSELFKSSEYPKKTTTIVERNPLSANHIFSKNALNSGSINRVEFNTLLKMADQLTDWIPDLVIYINTPPDVCVDRINSRKRLGEELIPFELLDNLHNLHTEYIHLVKSKGIKVHIIDGTQSVEKILGDCLKLICQHTENFC